MESIMKYRVGMLVVGMLFLLPALGLAKPAVPTWRDNHPWSTEVASVTVGDSVVQAEIADTPRLQQRGLGYRDSLAPGTAMIFVFDEASVQTFWMRGMRFCLDIVWIDDRKVIGAAESVCPMPDAEPSELPRYSSEVPVRYVLEVPAGWMATNGYGPGTPVTIILPDAQSE
jgi:uncharacterized protein